MRLENRGENYNNAIKIFEMFAGNRTPMFCLKELGVIPISVGYSEIKKAAIEVSNLNFPNDKNWGDCTKIIPQELPDFDLLTAGFPCQDVSMAGKNDLSKGRTILFDEIIRIAWIKQPRFMLLENVKGLLSKKHKDFFAHILSELERIGYKVKFKTLCSLDYNTPQKRERVYFACFREEIDYNNFEFPSKEEYVDDWRNYIDYEGVKCVNKTPSRDKMRIKCKNITNLKYCYTITQKQDRFPNAGIIDYEDYYRFLTPKEQFRLMGFFGDEIKLPKNLSKGALESLAGDGWDKNLITKILRQMLRGSYKVK